jgi:hypothetical protein
MKTNPIMPPPWGCLRRWGRLGLALAAGGAFAALAWESPRATESAEHVVASRTCGITAERQDIVKEDGVSPQLDRESARLTPGDRPVLSDEGRWGLREEETRVVDRDGARNTPWPAARCGADSTAGANAGGQTPTLPHEESYARATTGVNPRGPPSCCSASTAR